MKTGTIGFWSTDNSNLVFVRACANFSIHPFLRSIILVLVFISDHQVVYSFSHSSLKGEGNHFIHQYFLALIPDFQTSFVRGS